MSPTRRAVLRSGALLGGCAVAGCLGSGGRSACEERSTNHRADAPLSPDAAWPMAGFDAANTGHAPAVDVPTGDVGAYWRYSACTEAASGVAVAGGRVYAGGSILDGGTGSHVAGEWHGHQRTPAVVDGTRYVGTYDLEAHDAASDEVTWTFETDVDRGAVSAPAVADGVVYVTGVVEDATVYAVDAADGSERWRYEPETEADTTPAVADGTAYLVTSGAVTALDATAGRRAWRRTVEAEVDGPPTVADGTVYVAGEGVRALDAATGELRWHREDATGVEPPVAVAGDTVYAAVEAGVVALDVADGRERWRASLGGGGYVSPAVAGETVLTGGRPMAGEGRVHALAAADGSERWRFDTRSVPFGDYTRSGLFGSPVAVDGVVFVATAPGDVYALGEVGTATTG